MRTQQIKLPAHAPAPGLENRFARMRVPTRDVFDLVVSHVNAAMKEAAVNGLFKKQLFDAVKEVHRSQCLEAIKAYVFKDISRGTSKYSHNTHTLVNARKLLAEYQRAELPWFPELHHCGKNNNNATWLACPELQELCQGEQNEKRAAAVHQLRWLVDVEPMHLKHLDILVANFYGTNELADGTPLTPEMVAVASQYALLERLCEVIDGTAGRPTYEYMGNNTVRASHLAKQRDPTPHTYPILFPWALVQKGLATTRAAFQDEISEQEMNSLTGIGGRMNRCIKSLHAQYVPGWSSHFDRGLTNHKLRAMACAWLYAKASPGTKYLGFIQRVLGHASTNASLYYELVEHKKGTPFMTALATALSDVTSKNPSDMALISELKTVLYNKKHKKADFTLKSNIEQALR
jgi:hypothetical protein